MTINKLIYNENEINKFIDILPNLEKDEVYYICLFVRNKHLTPEENLFFGISRSSNLMARVIAREKNDIIRKIKNWECNSEAFISKRSNTNIPNKCLVPYITFNPVSTIKAYKDFNFEFIDYITQLSTTNDKPQIYKSLKKIDVLIMDKLQHAFSKKHFIDIDFDIPTYNWQPFFDFLGELKIKEVSYHVVKTKGGYHLLLETKTLNWNYNKNLENLRNIAKNEFKKFEIETNKNQAIPISGCYQYGDFEVKLIESNIGIAKK